VAIIVVVVMVVMVVMVVTVMVVAVVIVVIVVVVVVVVVVVLKWTLLFCAVPHICRAVLDSPDHQHPPPELQGPKRVTTV
jgi:hypothetical protein